MAEHKSAAHLVNHEIRSISNERDSAEERLVGRFDSLTHGCRRCVSA